MNTNVRVCKVLMAIILLSSAAIAAQRPETSPETKKRMLELITRLENDPYQKDARDIRGEVLKWLADAPDVNVTICTNVFGDIKKFKGDDGSTLVAQLLYSEAKFILEHPAQAGDQQAINVAGVEGILRVYEKMKAAKAKIKIEGAEKLAALKASGKLDAHVAQALAECSKPATD